MSVNDSAKADSSTGAQSFAQEVNVALGEDYSIEDYREDLKKEYAVYEPYGLTYDSKQDRFYYNGKLVQEFIDVLSSNGEDFEGGKFEGSMRMINNPDETGKVKIKTVRDYTKPNSEGEGKLMGIEVVD
ncbi:hypothetical protein D3C76_1507480 [compost metagenome]